MLPGCRLLILPQVLVSVTVPSFSVNCLVNALDGREAALGVFRGGRRLPRGCALQANRPLFEGNISLKMKPARYRACAGAVIFNKEGLFLVGERIGGVGQWQFPQVRCFLDQAAGASM